jgi:alkylation response protein AidB-like acyl-CoA dehydrogenase
MIESIPNELQRVCTRLSELSNSLATDSQGGQAWPTEQLQLLNAAQVSQWFIPKHLGGQEWPAGRIVKAYIQLSAACLTSTFILTQRAAAIKRICNSLNEALRDELLDGILNRDSQATVGISHLTTSRRHLGKPALAASDSNGDYVLNGLSPWVTGAFGCDFIVTGAQLEDGNQILLAVPKNMPGVTVEPGFEMIALNASQTGPVRFKEVRLSQRWLLAGPCADVLTTGTVSATGGYQTSALATGLATAAIDFLASESERRPEIRDSHDSLRSQLTAATDHLLAAAGGHPVCSNEELRTEANRLVLAASQAAMVAAKGAGFVVGHPVGRWCNEALFFLVWSCPQAVANANMCEFAGIES